MLHINKAVDSTHTFSQDHYVFSFVRALCVCMGVCVLGGGGGGGGG